MEGSMWIFLHDSDWFEITSPMRDFFTPKAEHVGFFRVSDAKVYLFRFMRSIDAMGVFRKIIQAQTNHSASNLENLRDDHVIDIMAEILARGGLKLGQAIHPARYRGIWHTTPRSIEDALFEQPALKESPPAPANGWIKIRIVDDETNRPAMGIGLDIKFPDGYESHYPVGVTGNIEVRAIASGRCDISCNFSDVYIEDCFKFVKVGENSAEQKGVQRQDQRAADTQDDYKAQKGSHLLDIEEHKVKDGETLESLAKQNDLTWQQLAYFNYGTKDLAKVNLFVANMVGSSKMTEDGKTYVFQSSDDPGIVYIPKRWSLANLDTDSIHTIRVKKVRTRKDITLELKTSEGLEIPEAEYSVVFADGSEKNGLLDKKGFATVSPSIPGPFSVTYPNHDDIRAKSMAAAMSKELQEKNLEKVIGLLTQPKDSLKDMSTMYTKYFNTLSGNGLVEDIDNLASGKDQQIIVDHLLVRAELKAPEQLMVVPWENPELL